jgi:hypothetical protein
MKKFMVLFFSFMFIAQLNAWRVTIDNNTTRLLSVVRLTFYTLTDFRSERITIGRGKKGYFEPLNTYGVMVQGIGNRASYPIGAVVAGWGSCEEGNETNRFLIGKLPLVQQAVQQGIVEGPNEIVPNKDEVVIRDPGGEYNVVNDPSKGECSIKISQARVQPVPGQIEVYPRLDLI